ncbi:MAG: transposase [Acidobacteriota bacterium]
MKRKRHGAEEIVRKLREAEVAQSEGKTLAQICKQLEISEQTYHRWKKQYGGLSRDEAQRLKKLEQENARLKKLVAEQALDIDMLKCSAPPPSSHLE